MKELVSHTVASVSQQYNITIFSIFPLAWLFDKRLKL